MESKDPDDNCNTETEEETIALMKKRARRVSFAETTAVHFYDREEESDKKATDTEAAEDDWLRRTRTPTFRVVRYFSSLGKVALLSVTAVHHLHIFIFVLAVVHVTTCALTVLFGGLKIRLWKLWEDAIQKTDHDPESVSGISDSTSTAQSQVSVGMGLLAGSTVMLLTAIWGSV